nr:hypothetical protein [Tanacetum cinerariifolium]
MSWDQYCGPSFLEFICILIDSLQVTREHGYLRLFLYPTVNDFSAGIPLQPTGFGEQYEELFRGTQGNLCGFWVFALLFLQLCRFLLYVDKLNDIMTARRNAQMLGKYLFIKAVLVVTALGMEEVGMMMMSEAVMAKDEVSLVVAKEEAIHLVAEEKLDVQFTYSSK